jgi:hypothetical protein
LNEDWLEVGAVPAEIETFQRTRLMDNTNRSNIPTSGGPKGALASRGAESAARVLKRLWGAVRR